MNVLITGISSGIGHGLALAHLARGDRVWGLSRREAPADLTEAGLISAQIDLAEFEKVPTELVGLVHGTTHFDLVWLNAGVLGRITDIGEASIDEMQGTFDINVWANKVVLDALYRAGCSLEQVVAISSGAAVNGNRGWNGYAVSKAALNMLIQLYAAEQKETHFCAFAPGLVDTAMQDYLCAVPADHEKLPSLERLKSARGTENMPLPDEAASRILSALPIIRTLPSGSFADIRQLSELEQ